MRASQIDVQRMILESKQQQEDISASSLQYEIPADANSSEHDEAGEGSDDTSERLANDAARKEADEDTLRTPESLPQRTPFRHRTDVVTKSCRCRADHKNRPWIGATILRFKYESTSSRSPACPVYTTSRRSQQRSIRLRYFWQCNRQAVGTLVSLTTSFVYWVVLFSKERCHAGGLSTPIIQALPCLCRADHRCVSHGSVVRQS